MSDTGERIEKTGQGERIRGSVESRTPAHRDKGVKEFFNETFIMLNKRRQTGFTLIELLVVMGIMALLAALVVPSIPEMMRSQKMSSAQNLIHTALAQAQAHAAMNQRFAGVRFQQAANGKQYVVLIEKGTKTPADYYAVPNAKATALSVGIGLISGEVDDISDPDLYLDDEVFDDVLFCLDGARTFSIVFSPGGQMVVKDVEVRTTLEDKIFGTLFATKLDPTRDKLVSNPLRGQYRLLSHDVTDSAQWCDREPSATGLYIYLEKTMEDVDSDKRYSEFISGHISENSVQRISINFYTGTMIEYNE